MVAGGPHQGRHGSPCTGAIGDDSFCIARHRVVEVTQVADGSFQVKDCFGCTACVENFLASCLFVLHDSRVASACSWYYHHVSLFQGPAGGIVCLRLCGCRGHVAAHVGAQEDWGLLRGPIGHVEVEVLIGRIFHLGYVVEVFIGRVGHFRAVVERDGTSIAGLGVKLQRPLCRCADSEAHAQHTDKSSFHHVECVIGWACKCNDKLAGNGLRRRGFLGEKK